MKKIAALFLLFVSFQLFAEKPRIAILDFEDNSGTLSKKLTKAQMQAERKVLSIYFRKQVRNKFIILSDSEQEAIIKKMKKESTRLDRNQVYKIATGMGVSADKILYTTIVPFGRKYTVTSELIDLEREIFDDENSMVGTADFDGTQESLREALRTIVDQLMGNEEEFIPQRPKKSDDQFACERARSLREPTGWIAYKKRYSNGICIEEADRELDKMGCELAKERNTVEDWEKYLERHPNGVCAVSMEADMAILKLKRQKKSGNGGNSVSNSGISGSNNSSIRDAKACEYAKNENSVDAWQDYLDSFPDGECSFEAKGNIRKLKKEIDEQEKKTVAEAVKYEIPNDGAVAEYNMAVSPLAVLDGADAAHASEISSAIEKVLDITGYFKVLDKNSFLEKPETAFKAVNFKAWLDVGANGLIKGTIRGKDDVELELAFFDVAKGKALIQKKYSSKAAHAKKSVFRFAAEVIKLLSGEEMKFMFSKIAFVEKTGEKYSLVVTNFDGSGRKELYSTSKTILLPEWSADGQKIFFTSQEKNNPNLYSIDVKTTQIKIVSAYDGLNVSASAYPDNKTIALCLSKDGNSEIYSLDTSTNELKRLTVDAGTDTAPGISPNGQEMVFVSNRTGNPQIYKMNLTDLTVERLTNQGNYNQDPEYSPDGTKVAFSGRGEKYQFDLFIIDLATRQISRLTQNQGKNESPTFSPDGKVIGFSSNRNGKSRLFLSNVSGTKQIEVYSGEGEVLTPSWSPML